MSFLCARGDLRPEGTPFIRGDVDFSGTLSVTDAVEILQYLFIARSYLQPEVYDLHCLDAGDVDDSGGINISDAIYLLSAAFRGGSEPPAPYPDCGVDPTPDSLGCGSSPRCAPFFYGLPIDADGVFFVIDRSREMAGIGEFEIIRQETIRSIAYLPEETQFGLVFYEDSVLQFPESGRPATADPCSKHAAISLVEATWFGGGSCVRDGLAAAVQMAKASKALAKVLFCASTGTGHCDENDEAVYLADTLDAITALNGGEVVIDTIGENVHGELEANFLKALAERNGGVCIIVPQ